MIKTLKITSGTLVICALVFLAGLQALTLIRDLTSETVTTPDPQVNSKTNDGVARPLNILKGRSLLPIGLGLLHVAEPDKSGALPAGSYGDASQMPQITIDGSGRITGYVKQPMIVRDKGGQVHNVLAYGADPSGEKDSTKAFQNCYDAVPLGGGIMFVPQGHYKIKGGSLYFGDKPFCMQGVGSRTRFGGYFGSPGWKDASKINGSVLHIQGAGDGITLGVKNDQSGGNRICTGVKLEGIALVGPGNGTSTGVNFNPTSGGSFSWDDIAIFNFKTGFKASLLYESGFFMTKIWACETGISFTGDVADLSFYHVDLRINRTALFANTGQEVHFFGGKIEGNTNYGAHIAPHINAQKYSFSRVGFEDNARAAIFFDTSNGGGINNCDVIGCGFAGPTDTVKFAESGQKLINSLIIMGCEAPGLATITLPANVVNAVLMGNGWAKAPVDNGAHNVIIEPNNSMAKFGGAANFDPSGNKVGFFGAKPVRQHTMGEAKAGSSYGANEQKMLQKVYNLLRSYGLGD